MIESKIFFQCLNDNGIEFFAGVPDSLLKSFNAYLLDNVSSKNHIIAANEGGAVALAAGYYLATGKLPMVYMQNSGMGNTVNPLLSLVDPEVYQVPMLLMIGWRGEPEKKDEPQHIKQGRIQNQLLDTLEIPYEIIDETSDYYMETIQHLVNKAYERLGPVALVVKKGTFSKYEPIKVITSDEEPLMSRESALDVILRTLSDNDVVVSTTGMASREIFELRARSQSGHHRDFLTVGSMGHTSQIAFGIALQKPERNVYCIDGDGAVIMHMGAMSIIGQVASENFFHIVLNNKAHDSVGGQPTAASTTDFAGIAKSCGYKYSETANNEDDLKNKLSVLKEQKGPSLLVVEVKKGARKDLGRPTRTPAENRKDFERNLRGK